MTKDCTEPLIVHTIDDYSECPDPDCAAEPGAHTRTLPCPWSWRHAHGRAYGSKPFPSMKCPGCRHIRRAGIPEVLVQTQQTQRKEPA